MVFTLLCTVCTHQEKEISLLAMLLPLVHIVYQDSPSLHLHLHEPPQGQGLGQGPGQGPGMDSGSQQQGQGQGLGQIPNYWISSVKSGHGQGHGYDGSSSTVTSVYSDTPHMVVKTPVKYATDEAKGKKECHYTLLL